MSEEREWRISEAAALLEKADRLTTIDPAAALPMLQKALRACRRTGPLCLESRAFAALGQNLALLNRLDHSETAYRVAYRPGCPCCRPVIDRRYAYLLERLGRTAEAVDRATGAVEAAKGPEKGLALVTLGAVRYESGDVSGAVEALTMALAVIPVRSRHHSIALANLTHTLAHSEDGEDVAEAARLLPKVENRFRGVKRHSQERAKLSWTTGQVFARETDFGEWTPIQRKRRLREARDHLGAAVKGLEKLGLLRDAAAARADLAAVLARLDPLTVCATLEGIPEKGEQGGRAFEFSKVRAAAIHAASGVFSPERIRQLWEALRALRNATVEAGAAPPVIAYAP